MLCGIDEAGRGCLAGPLFVAGVVLQNPIKGLNDSKLLSEKQRELLFEIIIQNSHYKIVSKTNEEIDSKGLSVCLKESILSIQEAFKECDILMDGNSAFGVRGIQTMIKADAKIPEVSAASILAKVSRDRYMYDIASEFPQYEFEKHKGYGTSLHVEKIKSFGYSSLHRKTFKIKNIMQSTLF